LLIAVGLEVDWWGYQLFQIPRQLDDEVFYVLMGDTGALEDSVANTVQELHADAVQSLIMCHPLFWKDWNLFSDYCGRPYTDC
jgi:hypothetical protein